MQHGPAVAAVKKDVETRLHGEMDLAASNFKVQLDAQKTLLRDAKADRARCMVELQERFEHLNQQLSASIQAEIHACASDAGA